MIELDKNKKLSDVMPEDFLTCSFDRTRAFTLRDVRVIAQHFPSYNEVFVQWPGKHKNVYFWVELENGFAVGWNENPANGWSFPVINLKNKRGKNGSTKKI